MDFFDVVRARYSHKENFLPEAVPMVDLEKIAHAGLAAPNGANRQLVRLIILPDRTALDPVASIINHGGLNTAPAAIAILTTDDSPSGHISFEKEDYSAALENMLLAATAMGYAALWLDYPWIDAANQRHVKETLGIPANYHLWATMPIGKPDGTGSRRDKMPPTERIFYRQYAKKEA